MTGTEWGQQWAAAGRLGQQCDPFSVGVAQPHRQAGQRPHLRYFIQSWNCVMLYGPWILPCSRRHGKRPGNVGRRQGRRQQRSDAP